MRPRLLHPEGNFFQSGSILYFLQKEKSDVGKRMKENPPQDLTRLCFGAKGQLMNYGWRRNGNQFLSQTPPPVALGI